MHAYMCLCAFLLCVFKQYFLTPIRCYVVEDRAEFLCTFCVSRRHLALVNWKKVSLSVCLISLRISGSSLSDYRMFGYYWSSVRQNFKCAPSEDSDQPGHPPSLIRFFTVRMKKAWVLSNSLSAQRRLLADWADAQTGLSLRWAHIHIVVLLYAGSFNP